MTQGGVKGSWDAPPLVIYSATWKSLLGLLGSLAFIALSIWLLRVVRGNTLVLAIVAGFFALCALAYAGRLFRPVSVALSPRGIVIFNGWRTVDLAWSDFAEFGLTHVYSTVLIGFRMAPSFKGRLGLRMANMAIAGVDGALPTGLALSTRDLAELVRTASEKWARPPVPFVDAS